MATITKPILLNETFVEKMDAQNNILSTNVTNATFKEKMDAQNVILSSNVTDTTFAGKLAEQNSILSKNVTDATFSSKMDAQKTVLSTVLTTNKYSEKMDAQKTAISNLVTDATFASKMDAQKTAVSNIVKDATFADRIDAQNTAISAIKDTLAEKMDDQNSSIMALNTSIAEKMDKQNALLSAIVRDRTVNETLKWSDISAIVRRGNAPDVFRIGDQLMTTWTDESGKVYDVPLDVVHFGNVELKNGSVVPGMYLQWHYLTPYDVPFNWNYALYYAANGLTAGTYHVTAKSSWGTSIVGGDSYSFTLTKNVPAGGLVCANYGFQDTPIAKWIISTYENSTSTVAIESGITVFVESAGTFLGDFGAAPFNNDTAVSGLSHFHTTAYGTNRWSKSALRQWLNSSADVGKWWTPQTKFDRPWTEAASKRGFMAGLDSEFVSVLSEIKVVTANNNVEQLPEDRDVTYDKFFLPSTEQEYIVSQATGIEGEAWEYWKRAKGLSSPQVLYDAGKIPEAIRYEIINKTAQGCRLRSALRYNAYGAWYVHSSGYVYGYGAIGAYRCAPACVIC